MRKFTLSDREIRLLKFLFLNGAHHSVSYIGKKLRLSPQTIAYKIKQLEEWNIILGYRYRINPPKLGLKHAAWCAMRAKTHTTIEETVNKLLSHPNIFSVLNLAGQFDIVAKVFYSEPLELTELIEWLGINFKNEISQISVMPVIKVNKLHQVPTPDDEAIRLDDVSLAILNYKLTHPNASLVETARAVGVHRNTVSRRWNQLWRNGVLLKKSVIFSPEVYSKLGAGIFGCVFINTMPGEQKKIANNLTHMQPIHELFSLASSYDLLAILRNKDISECYENIRMIYSTGKVARTQTLIVLAFKEKQTPILPVH